MDKQQAEKAIKNAWIAAIVLAVIRLFTTIYFSDIRHFVDIALYLFVALAFYKKNKIFSVIAFIFVILVNLSFVITFFENLVGIIGLALAIFTFIMIQGIRGIFYYHKLKPLDSPK